MARGRFVPQILTPAAMSALAALCGKVRCNHVSFRNRQMRPKMSKSETGGSISAIRVCSRVRFASGRNAPNGARYRQELAKFAGLRHSFWDAGGKSGSHVLSGAKWPSARRSREEIEPANRGGRPPCPNVHDGSFSARLSHQNQDVSAHSQMKISIPEIGLRQRIVAQSDYRD